MLLYQMAQCRWIILPISDNIATYITKAYYKGVHPHLGHGGTMLDWRKWAVAIIIVFLILAVLNDPVDSATTTGNAWDHVKDGISAVGIFFDTLLDS
jgi:hypothetical protein